MPVMIAMTISQLGIPVDERDAVMVLGDGAQRALSPMRVRRVVVNSKSECCLRVFPVTGARRFGYDAP